jgi:hypothetical protein
MAVEPSFEVELLDTEATSWVALVVIASSWVAIGMQILADGVFS